MIRRKNISNRGSNTGGFGIIMVGLAILGCLPFHDDAASSLREVD